jgi:hypothetical protein
MTDTKIHRAVTCQPGIPFNVVPQPFLSYWYRWQEVYLVRHNVRSTFEFYYPILSLPEA